MASNGRSPPQRERPPGSEDTLLGLTITIKEDRRVGTLLAVRSRVTSEGNLTLMAFIRFKDLERRFADWIPVEHIDPAGLPESYGRCILAPEVNCKALEPISLDLRATFKNTLEFLEERLRRDMASPNSFYQLHYLGYVMKPWYYSPLEVLYPQFSVKNEVLRDVHLCPFTLTPFESFSRLQRHLASHVMERRLLSPPGREVYCDRDAGLSLYEVDGAVDTAFCRNLFLISKCYLENKLVGYDTDIYYFYVLALHAPKWAPRFMKLPESVKDVPKLFAGYYSYEKGSVVNNLACIVTLPCFQGHGFGRFLIAASYAVGYKRGILGSPEKPLSDLGQAAYDKYWSERLWRWATKKLRDAASDPSVTIRPGNFDEPANSSAVITDAPTFASMHTTIDSISRSLKLDPSDVLDTVLRLGLVHKADGKLLKLVIPVDLAVKQLKRADNVRAPFKSALLQEVAK